MNEWINVKDRCPEQDTKVLVYSPDERYQYSEKGRIFVAEVSKYKDGGIRFDSFCASSEMGWLYRPTHWMPLPELPPVLSEADQPQEP